MKEIPLQLLDKCPICKQSFGLFFMPYGEEAIEDTKSFKAFQIVRAVVYGIQKPRSVKQLGTYWAVCGYVAQLLSDHENILDRKDIDFDVKIRVAKKKPAMIKRFKMIDGITYIEPISIAFKNLPHLMACDYFSIAFDLMAEDTGLSVDVLIEETKKRMKTSGNSTAKNNTP